MKEFLVSIAVLIGFQVSGQNVENKKDMVLDYSVFRSYEISSGIGGVVPIGDKLSGKFSGGIDLNKRLKVGVSVGVSRFDGNDYLPIKVLLDHQWNFSKFFVFQQAAGGYTYSLNRPDQVNLNNWFTSYSRVFFGGLSLEGILGMGIPLNEHVNFRFSVSYNYQEINEEWTHNNFNSSVTKVDSYYNRIAISGGLIFSK